MSMVAKGRFKRNQPAEPSAITASGGASVGSLRINKEIVEVYPCLRDRRANRRADNLTWRLITLRSESKAGRFVLGPPGRGLQLR
jgi:hypothetical protein